MRRRFETMAIPLLTVALDKTGGMTAAHVPGHYSTEAGLHLP